MPWLKRHDKGARVRQLQLALNWHFDWIVWNSPADLNPYDIDLLDVDGDFGPATEKLLKRFQVAAEVPPIEFGKAGPETQEQLHQHWEGRGSVIITPPGPPNPVPPFAKPVPIPYPSSLADATSKLPIVAPGSATQSPFLNWLKTTKLELEAGQKQKIVLSGSDDEKNGSYVLVWDAKWSVWSAPILPKLLEPTAFGPGVGQEFRFKQHDNSGRVVTETNVYAFGKLESNGWGKRGEHDLFKVELELTAGRKWSKDKSNWDVSTEVSAGPELVLKKDILKFGAAPFFLIEGIGGENTISAGLKLTFTLGTPPTKRDDER
jgi:hypothetical protein